MTTLLWSWPRDWERQRGSTHANSNAIRVIVYDKWMPAGTHTVRVVNLATLVTPGSTWMPF